MTNTSFLSDLMKLTKVLESCVNYEQVLVTEKYFELFLKKWGSDIPKKQLIDLENHLDKIKKNKLSRLKKNKN